jgi:adenylate kinase
MTNPTKVKITVLTGVVGIGLTGVSLLVRNTGKETKLVSRSNLMAVTGFTVKRIMPNDNGRLKLLR